MATQWIAASRILGRPVTDDEPYPHICNLPLPAARGRHGRPIRTEPKDCAACAHEHYQHKQREQREQREQQATV